jgi:tRNA 2-thiouridine synthesizing protein C
MSENHSRTISFVSRKPPYGTDGGQMCLDLVLAAAIYDQQVNYLFTGDGIYQLLPEQQPAETDSKNLGAALRALELYGVEKVYVDQRSLTERQLTSDDLLLQPEILDDAQFAAMLRESDLVFNL